MVISPRPARTVFLFLYTQEKMYKNLKNTVGYYRLEKLLRRLLPFLYQIFPETDSAKTIYISKPYDVW